MVLQKLARMLLDSRRVRAVWQTDVGWYILGLLPDSLRQYLKAFYRRVLVVPTVLPAYTQSKLDSWDHNKPILSVVMPCYNYGRFIREALQSLRAQTFTDFEIIVVDDGSTEDLTLKILDDLRNEGMRVLREEKLNAASALNLGIREARGRYICCLAADDTIEPTYFEKSLCLLESNPGVTFAYTLVETFGDEKRTWFTEPFDLRLLLEYNYICAAAIFRRSIWDEVGGFDQSMEGYEDWDFWIKVGKTGSRGKLIPEILFNYRRHGTTLNLRSDRKYKNLIDHIRANHDDLYSRLERITEIQSGYHDIRVSEPFLNLSSNAQYSNSIRTGGAILVSSNDTHIEQSFSRELAIKPKQEHAVNFVLLAAHDSFFERDISASSVSQAYCVERFLDPYCWLDFVVNLIMTRSARYVAIVNPILTSEWASAVRTRTSALVVNLIQDQSGSELFRLSAKCDEFVSLHIVFSEHAARALTDDFGVAPEKIQSLANMESSDIVHELSKILRSLEEK